MQTLFSELTSFAREAGEAEITGEVRAITGITLTAVGLERVLGIGERCIVHVCSYVVPWPRARPGAMAAAMAAAAGDMLRVFYGCVQSEAGAGLHGSPIAPGILWFGTAPLMLLDLD